MKVSIVTPTRNRDEVLPSLYRVFASQTYTDIELLVCDDSDSPSATLREVCDTRVKYQHFPYKLGMGAKRDWLVREADGDIIVQFDDDDFYAPCYVEHMMGYLREYEFIKLSHWFLYDQSSQGLFYWDTSSVLPTHYRLAAGLPPTGMSMTRFARDPDWRERQLWGYGFSYAFKKAIYERVQFDKTIEIPQEDYPFARQAREHSVRMQAIPDERGLAMHIVHRGSSSFGLPNYRVPNFMIATLFKSEGVEYLRTAPHLAEEPVDETGA